MKTGDTVVCGGISYKVLDKVGTGGQGSVWKVKSLPAGEMFALKVIEEKNAGKRMAKIANIRRIVSEELLKKMRVADERDGVKHVFPLSVYSNGNETGYIMDFVEGKTLKAMLYSGEISAMSVSEKLLLAKKVAQTIDNLHSIGYCYTDINWGNFVWNKATGTMYMIDCENVANSADIHSGKCEFLKGTGFFMAPEVAFNKEKAAYNSDKYALAILIFCMIIDGALDSPYHGIAMYSARPMCGDMCDVAEYEADGDIDKDWRVFIFDKNNRKNNVDELCKNSTNPANIEFRKHIEWAIKIWNGLDDRLKDMFCRAFADPFDVAARPMASTWINLIDRLTGAQQKCLGGGSAGVSTPPAVQKKTQKPAVKPVQAPAPARDINAVYKPFVPAGGKKKEATPRNMSVSKPCAVSSDGCAVSISGNEFMLMGADLGMPAYEHLGKLKSTGEGYEFTSHLLCNVTVRGADNSLKSRISRGQTVKLDDGDVISLAVTPITISILF